MKRPADNRGFTLIEIIVATLLLLIVMAGFVPVFLTGLGNASTTRAKSIATNIARQRMEQVRQMDYREIGGTGGDTGQILANHFASREGNDPVIRGYRFHITYAVAEFTPSGSNQPLKKVTITVSWDAPPKPSPAVVQTLIHQQFLGPRGALLEVIPTQVDNRVTPFPMLISGGDITLKYHLAQADWKLVYGSLNPPSDLKGVYLRVAFVDDSGYSILLGTPSQDPKIDNTRLYNDSTGGPPTDVWFQYSFNLASAGIADGYWEIQAQANNEYDQPGNLWRLRVRVETGAPAAPTNLVAAPQGDSTVVLTWTPGPERDLAYYWLERQKSTDGVNYGEWVRIGGDIPPTASGYTDTGSSLDPKQDPWGDVAATNYYRYRIRAIDFNNPANAGGWSNAADVLLPPPATTTTTTGATTTTTGGATTTSATTTTTAPTTTTTTLYSVRIQNNNNNKNYNVEVKDSSNRMVYAGTVPKNGGIVTVSGLPTGPYQITATASGRPTVTGSFSVPAQANQIVLTIT